MRKDEFPIVDKFVKNSVNAVLKKIRLDIALMYITEDSDEYGDEAKWLNMGLRTALEVIDKYKAKEDKIIEKEAIKIFQDKTKPIEHKQEPFDDIILTLTKRVVTQVTEDMDNFIFTTIKPWCEEKEQRIISKRDLEQALTQYFSKEPCKDAISRQAAINACLNGWNKDYKEIVAEIRTLPPVTPQPKTGWIPVSERLPKKFRYINCTCHSLIDDREDWVVETCYVPQPSNSPYSDWGNFPMLNDGDCEVVAWMYREIPKPYKAESEDKE